LGIYPHPLRGLQTLQPLTVRYKIHSCKGLSFLHYQHIAFLAMRNPYRAA